MKKQIFCRGVTAAAIIACFAGFSAAQAQETYKIGYITDLSGPLAGSYTPTWEGFELYIKALNDRGGINGKKWVGPLLPRNFKAPINYRWPEYVTTVRGTEWWIPEGA